MNGQLVVIVLTLVIIAAIAVYLIHYLNKQNAPIRTTVVQLLTLLLIVPLVFLLAYLDKIDSHSISVILGAIIGYVFSKVPLKEEWGGNSNKQSK